VTNPQTNPTRTETAAESVPLPPRRKAHPSNKMKMVRMFYNALIATFLLLTAGLIAWGYHFLE